MTDFQRSRDGFRAIPGGLKLNVQPDALPPGKYAALQSVRGYRDSALVTRPGQALLFSTGGAPITDIHDYVGQTLAGGMDAPRTLARDSQDRIYLDTGALVGTLAGSGASPGAAMIPFRPSETPDPYLYIANGTDYQKFSSPSATNAVVQQKVGIAEPPVPPDAALLANRLALIGANPGTGWVNAGTAGGASTSSYISDTAGACLQDPTPGTNVWSIAVAANLYRRGMEIQIAPAGVFLPYIVQDVFPVLVTSLTIQAITYFSGTTGRCVIVPANMGSGANPGASINQQPVLASLRRGALIRLGPAFMSPTETCLVWSVTSGPNGTICIETSTVGTFTTADVMTSTTAIQVISAIPMVLGAAISESDATYQVTVGVGTQTAPINDPFVLSGAAFQVDDYFTIGILIDDPTMLIEMKIQLSSGSTFTDDYYYYTVRPADISPSVANAATQLAVAQEVVQRALIDLQDASSSANQGQTFSSSQAAPGASQWTQFVIPLAQFTHVGADQTSTMQIVNYVQILWNASGTINVGTNEMAVFGSYQPDVGDIGSPYLYRVRPRSAMTGVRGNPSPVTRYGVNPRRNSVLVALPSPAYDPQIDTWDIFRYGGSVTSWRFIGQTPSTNASFTDNFDDRAADSGDPLDFDNFEPWPSVTLPVAIPAVVVVGFTAFTIGPISSILDDVLRLLPGNLVQIAGQNVFTLRSRPTRGVGLFSQHALFQFEENAGAIASAQLNVYEPAVAAQPLPYMWGPDASGTVFACGDPLRPGTVYFTKPNNPDSAPDSYNMEITPPSEPLIGGLIVDGLSFVASTDEWWALYPQPGNPARRFNPVQQPFPRGLIAPYAACTDGRSIYWWAKDGIYSTVATSVFSIKGSLTDGDLYGLFPHEGIRGSTFAYSSFAVFPPDYASPGANAVSPGSFRLAYSNGYLYATYKDSQGTYRALTYDTRHDSWCVDSFTPPVSVVYHPEQGAAPLTSSGGTRYPQLFMGNVLGQVATEALNANDLGGAITCLVGFAEFDGADLRAPKQWGDYFVDLIPAASTGVSLAPMSQGALVGVSSGVPSASTRQRLALSIGGSTGATVVSDFLGLYLQWTDNFLAQSSPTTIFSWQPSFAVQPARTTTYRTFGSSFGLQGYMHVRQMMLAYVSIAPVVLTIRTVDGLAPQPILLPSTSGVYTKSFFPVTANKGLLYSFEFASPVPPGSDVPSSAQFQLFLEDSEFSVGAWQRSGAYQVYKTLGVSSVSQSPI